TGALQTALSAGGPAGVVNEISVTTLGAVGGFIAILGIVVLPITTGDTALRSCRMMLAELLTQLTKKDFNGKGKVALLIVPVAGTTLYLTTIDYSFLWRYVGGTNQIVAAVMLWTATMYLLKNNKFHWICSIPALFMTAVVSTYFFYAPEGFNLDYRTSLILGMVIWVAVLAWFIKQLINHKAGNN